MPKISSHLERTVLHATTNVDQLEKAVGEAKQHLLAGLTVPPFWVKKVKRDLGLASISLATVIGFPFGYQRTEAKITEIENALKDGATDLEVTMNNSALVTPSATWIKIELVKCATLAHAHNAMLTVIMEGSLLEEDQVKAYCKISADAGADFVKNATGFVTSPLLSSNLVTQIEMFRRFLPSSVGIKATGKIRSSQEVQRLLEAGAARICIDAPVASLLNMGQRSY